MTTPPRRSLRSRPTRVAVVGGGLAGITAALAAADRGAQVTLFESRQTLGGLARSLRRGERWIDNGQHVFLRCCSAYRALLERLGVSDLVTIQPRLDITVLRPGRPPARLRRGRLPRPLHLVPALLSYGPLSPAQRVRVLTAATALRRVDPADPIADATDFGGWLAEHGQGAAALAALWDLVGTAALNLRAEDASLAAAAMVFQTGLLSEPDAGDLGWATVPLHRLHHDAAMAALTAAGVTVHTATKVHGLDPSARWRLLLEGRDHETDAVVLAVPASTAEQFLPPGAVDQQPGWSARLGGSPIVNVHLHYDRPVLEAPFAAAVGSQLQWVFDRTSQSGTSTGQHLAVSFSAADDVIERPARELRALTETELARLLPGAREAEVIDSVVTRERQATFRAAPGQAALRPSARTRYPGLAVAGAWTATGWPATMEGAVRSGAAAASAALQSSETRELAVGALR